VIIDDADENAFVHGIAGADAWIGAHDRGENGGNCTKAADEGTWYWVDPSTANERGAAFCAFSSDLAYSCSPLEGRYNAWGVGQPDNASCSCGPLPPLLGRCNEGDDCAVIAANDGRWADVSCASANRYICEGKPAP
jgi:hypothetical protein